MLDFNKVFSCFMLFSKLDTEEGNSWKDFVELAMQEVEQKVKAGVDEAKYERLLTQLAAAIAYYRYAVLANRTSESMNAFDIHVAVDGTKQIDAAGLLRDELVAAAKSLLQDNDFLFGRM